MFNFKNPFKKEVEKDHGLVVSTQSVLEIVSNDKNYPKEVLEIHHEFSIAAENLLVQAKSIIEEAATKDADKVSRLDRLGFKQANQVSEIKPLLQKAELSKDQVQMVKYYQMNYPLNKFITEEQVKAICHKWNLICGNVSLFKGFVPEKNLKEIEQFKLKECDEVEIEVTYGYTFYPIKEVEEKLNHSAFESHRRFRIVDKNGKYSYISLQEAEGMTGLKICAPVKDMDLTGMTIKNGYKVNKIHVPDPVVLQPVKGGYLILTAWGDEASDELVVNQKMN